MLDCKKLLIPVNKTAALVVAQNEESDTEFMALSRKQENLKLAIRANNRNLLLTESKAKKRKLSLRKHDLEEEILPINKRIKELNMQRRESINSLIIKECMLKFSEKEWGEIRAEANRKFRMSEPQDA